MPFTELGHFRIKRLFQKFIEEHGPPPHIQDKLKWGYRIDSDNQSVELFEIRPHFLHPEKKTENKIAKATFVKKSMTWKVYWMRGNMRWCRYETCPEVLTIEEFLKVVKEDAYNCFFG